MRYGRARLHVRRRLFDAEHEVQAREHRLQRHAHAALEAARLRALLVELHQLIHVGLRHRPAIRLRRHAFDDAPGARHVFLWRRRTADEDGASRRDDRTRS